MVDALTLLVNLLVNFVVSSIEFSAACNSSSESSITSDDLNLPLDVAFFFSFLALSLPCRSFNCFVGSLGKVKFLSGLEFVPLLGLVFVVAFALLAGFP